MIEFQNQKDDKKGSPFWDLDFDIKTCLGFRHLDLEIQLNLSHTLSI